MVRFTQTHGEALLNCMVFFHSWLDAIWRDTYDTP